MISRAKWPFGNGVQQHVDPAPDGKPAAIPSSIVSADTRQFGLENFGNTCYANSVMQALYFCTPFRSLLLQENDASIPSDHQIPPVVSLPPPIVPVRRKGSGSGPSSESFNHPNGTPPKAAVFSIPSNPPTMFSALRSLFLHISTNPMEKGTVSPRAFIDKLKEFNELFRSSQHQDAHEFLNYLLNKIVEEIEESRRPHEDCTLPAPTVVTATTSSNSGTPPEDMTFIHKLFEGILTSETRCLTCETVSARDESFLDLSIDIEQNSSVTACLRQFSASEMLCQKNKFFCDSCGDLQEAEKRMKIKRLPNVLALHLKRFKVQEDVQKFIKLAYRVAFPLELRLFNTVDDMYDADKLFDLFAIVIHIGNGPHHGHYISIIKTVGGWQVFDDENVSTIVEGDIPKYFGESPSGSAYVLFYQ
ncbi:cysteine proteinase, partial [Fistulina hepatica ATCC 64428]